MGNFAKPDTEEYIVQETFVDEEHVVSLEDYTPQSLRYMRAFHTTIRALLGGVVSAIPVHDFKQYTIRSFIAYAQHLPLSRVYELYQLHAGNLSMQRLDKSAQRYVPSNGTVTYSMDMFEQYGIVSLEKQGTIKTTVSVRDEVRDVVAATAGHILAFTLHHPELPVEKILPKGVVAFDSLDDILVRARVLKYLAHHLQGEDLSLTPSMLARAVNLPRNLVNHAIVELNNIGVISYFSGLTAYSYDPASLESIPRMETYTKDLIEYMYALQQKDNKDYHTLPEIIEDFLVQYPQYGDYRKGIWKKMNALEKIGLIQARNRRIISLTSEQYDCVHNIVHIIDNSIMPSAAFLQQGKEMLMGILESPQDMRSLANTLLKASQEKATVESSNALQRAFIPLLPLVDIFPREVVVEKMNELVEDIAQREYSGDYLYRSFLILQQAVNERKGTWAKVEKRLRPLFATIARIHAIFEGASALFYCKSNDQLRTIQSPVLVGLVKNEPSGFAGLLDKISSSSKSLLYLKGILSRLDRENRPILCHTEKENGVIKVLCFVSGQRLRIESRINMDATYFPLLLEICKQLLENAYKKTGLELPFDAGEIVRMVITKSGEAESNATQEA